MAGRSSSAFIIVLAGSAVALVIAALVMMRPGTSSRASDSDEPQLAPLGLNGLQADSARRGEREQEVAPEAAPVLPEPRPEAVASPEDDPRRDEPQPEPAPPIPPSAAAEAESEAIMAVRAQVQKEVKAAVESRHRAIRNACWNGSKSGSATLPMQASFGADGGLLALSIADDRGAPELGACVRAQPLPLKVDPPGVGVTVDVPLTFP